MRSIAILLLSCVVGCASQAAPARPEAQPAGTLGQIRALIGNAACTETSQCHTLPIGARACGGPQSYLPWSSKQTSGDALRALGDRFKAEREAEIKAKGEMSDCRFIVDPGAVCRAGTCQVGTALPER
jgi:hypothetical protein